MRLALSAPATIVVATACSALSTLLILLPATADAAESIIFNSSDQEFTSGYSNNPEEESPKSCFPNTKTSVVEPNILKVSPSKWHSGGLYFGCQEKNSSWQCVKSCYHGTSFGSNPNFSSYGYLTFQAKVSNDIPHDDCHPTIGLGKRWPQYSSKVLTLSGPYVEHGILVDDEFRTVVIPTTDFISDELCGESFCWPAVNDVKALWFRSCGTAYSAQPQYEVKNIMLTDDPPVIVSSGGGAEDSSSSSPTAGPTATPTTTAPTGVPTAYPTRVPTAAPTERGDSVIFGSVGDALSHGEDDAVTCLAGTPASAVESTDGIDPDYLQVAPTKWHSGGIKFGCAEKNDSWQCIKSCYDDGSFGSNPDFSSFSHLTFKARVSGNGGACQPAVSIVKRWPQYASKKIELTGEYVDAGTLVGEEWRNVVLPTSALVNTDDLCNGATCWPTLDGVANMWFHSCGTDFAVQPVYQIADMALTNDPPALVSEPPTPAPTPYVTVSPSLATHRRVHCDWFPILDADRDAQVGKTWVVASHDLLPSIDPAAADHTVSVHIPVGQTVTYSASSSPKLDKVIVEGTLIIAPADGNDVKLTLGTLVVERTGTLHVHTDDDASTRTVTIEIDGELDRTTDPTEMMLGLLSLEGHVNVTGNAIGAKMAPLAATADAASTTIVLSGSDAATYWAVGDEIILPDTQTCLDVGHWNFPNNEPNGYADQIERRSIASVSTDASGANTVLSLDGPLLYAHSTGAHAAHVTRSITFVTSPSSVDRGHILHTGGGGFVFKNARVEGFGRTTTEVVDNTVIEDASGLNFPPGLAQMSVVHQGSNQLSRYALHAHRARVECIFHGNAILHSPRNGIVPHDSRVIVTENIVVGADGSAVFLEDSTETGPVHNNFIVGTGGGSRGGDDGRFSSSDGIDMGHGGFGIWARGLYCNIANNRAEGHFGVAPYAYFVHPKFVSDKVVPDVPGTPAALVGKSSSQISSELNGDLSLNTYGSFVNNSAFGTWKNGLDLSYFGRPAHTVEGHVLENADVVALAKSGRGASTIHSSIFTMRGGSIDATCPDNTITAVFCNNCNGCTLEWREENNPDVSGVETIRGGNC